MPETDEHIGYLLAVDAFSKRMFVEVLNDHKNESVISAFKKIFKEKTGNLLPSKIEVDNDRSIVGAKGMAFFQKEGIYVAIRRGRNKGTY